MPDFPAPLCRHIPQWIAAETSETVAQTFSSWVLETLSGLGYDPTAPVSEETFERITAELQQADVTPARMQMALKEARRAKMNDLSTLEWGRNVQQRAYSEEMADGAFQLAKSRLKRKFDKEEGDLQKPPTPEEIFAFLLAWEELGGSSALAALRELQQQDEGMPPQN